MYIPKIVSYRQLSKFGFTRGSIKVFQDRILDATTRHVQVHNLSQHAMVIAEGEASLIHLIRLFIRLLISTQDLFAGSFDSLECIILICNGSECYIRDSIKELSDKGN